MNNGSLNFSLVNVYFIESNISERVTSYKFKRRKILSDFKKTSFTRIEIW